MLALKLPWVLTGHSYVAWKSALKLENGLRMFFLKRPSFPDRSHDLFRVFFKDSSKFDLKIEASQKRLPETVLTFVEQENGPKVHTLLLA